MTETVSPDASITYEPDDGEALVEAMRGVHRLLSPGTRDAARATAWGFDADVLSRRFATALWERFSGRPQAD